MSGDLWLLWVPGLPLLVGAVLLLGGRYTYPVASGLGLAGAAGSLALGWPLWQARPALSLPWLPLPDGHLPLTLSGAGEGAVLAAMVAALGLVVMLYSVDFLDRAEDRSRYFGLMSLFLGAMLILVLADDLLTLLLGWEGVGACSYALIGFWYHEPVRARAALRAFVTTRAADLGLYLAAMAAFAGASGLAMDDLAQLPAGHRALVAAGLITAALGKSAQLPFSGWLKGAMQGPSPVSALLHSATMVAAGAVLLIKIQPLLEAVAWAAPLVLWLGVITALAAALTAFFQAGAKDLLAASTVSQYGYMFAALAVGGVAAGSGHLLNHAVFKALLFLVAGVVVRNHLHRFDEMGGLWRWLPVTALLALVGALALAPLPPMGGFFSKEALVASVTEHRAVAGWLLLLVGTPLTAAYAGRWLLTIFAGRPGHGVSHPPRGAGVWMSLAMALLALAALAGVALALHPLAAKVLAGALGVEAAPAFHLNKAILTGLLVLLGLGWAGFAFYRHRLVDLEQRNAFGGMAAQWFGLVTLLDRIGGGAVALGVALDWLERRRPGPWLAARLRGLWAWQRDWRRSLPYAFHQLVLMLARLLGGFDRRILGGRLTDGSGRGSQRLAGLSALTDRRVLDGAIHALNRGLDRGAGWLGQVQGGMLYRYYLWMTVGVAALLGYALVVMSVP